MKAIYYQQGSALDFCPEENVQNGSVVDLTTRIGIAVGDIPAGTPGSIHVEGVYRLAKAKGEALAMGAAVCYDKAADAITAAESGNTPAGYAAAPAKAEETSVLVKLLG
jgi:predicted RecA/RadA family phage recombinase